MSAKSSDRNGEHRGMEQMAGSIQEHHDRPIPGSADLFPNPFPPAVLNALWISALAGGLLGIVFGRLLSDGVVVIDNWEQLYSVGDFTLIALWAAFGVALGAVIGGTGSILIASSFGRSEQNGPPENGDEDQQGSRNGRAPEDFPSQSERPESSS